MADDKRYSKILRGDSVLGLVPKNLGELDEGDVISFAYKAESPGFPKKGSTQLQENLYDANPMVVLTDIKSIKGNILVYGLNINYLDRKLDRGRTILSLRTNKRMNKRYYLQCIHAYRLDRVQSKLYKARNFISDAELLKSIPQWKEIKQSPQ